MLRDHTVHNPLQRPEPLGYQVVGLSMIDIPNPQPVSTGGMDIFK